MPLVRISLVVVVEEAQVAFMTTALEVVAVVLVAVQAVATQAMEAVQAGQVVL
jgi:hypothetical protein